MSMGGAKGHHGSTKMGGANPYGNSIHVGGAEGHHGNTKMGGANPYGNSTPVGGAKGHHDNTRGRSQALLATVSLWAGLRVTMAALRWAKPILR